MARSHILQCGGKDLLPSPRVQNEAEYPTSPMVVTMTRASDTMGQSSRVAGRLSLVAGRRLRTLVRHTHLEKLKDSRKRLS